MGDFVIVVATIAAIASASPVGPGAAVPDRQPTVGFKTYQSLEACEQAAAGLRAPPASRLVCLPIELPQGGLASAY
ncbi:hypothetical protein [Siccirubricoccus sp. G192]|uniref:hypothetical protein n=1 Tax=Siccirubricoccus sp. G192 TaxID=2849651 RepID=UPI001C2C9C31|nr:hypothetical protein [Siccirubricoccus sp. G192]MBV1799328.1 hypothetical protein [Siccirubricoccus sp. G192]